jgi:flagellar protein FliT
MRPTPHAGSLPVFPVRIGRRSRRSFREQCPAMGLTMLPMASQIEIYQEMSALSSRMVDAARASDWDNLIKLEKSVVALRLSLAADEDNSRLTSSEIETKRTLIQRILDDDAEIRRHTEPWMEQVRQFLGGTARRKQVESAYGAST